MNCAIYKKGSNVISYFIINCIKHGDYFEGDNAKLSRVKPEVFDHLWTEGTANPVMEPGNEDPVGWDMTVDQLTPANEGAPEVSQPDRAERSDAMRKLLWLSTKSYAQVDNYIDANVVDLASARQYLKDLSRVVLAELKVLADLCCRRP